MIDGLIAMRHSTLLAIGLVGLFIAVVPQLFVLRRMGRAVLRRPQNPWGVGRYLTLLMTSLVFGGVGLSALGLWMALCTFGDLGKERKKTHAAEIQCIELAPSKLRVYLVPLDAEGRRGATETYDVDGDQWQVGGDLLRFRPLLEYAGVKTVYQVTRVEGRWLKAEDAKSHKVTAFDRATTGSGWLALYKDATRGPLGWLVQGVNGGAVSQLPDRRALYDLYVTEDGFTVDKKRF